MRREAHGVKRAVSGWGSGGWGKGVAGSLIPVTLLPFFRASWVAGLRRPPLACAASSMSTVSNPDLSWVNIE